MRELNVVYFNLGPARDQNKYPHATKHTNWRTKNTAKPPKVYAFHRSHEAPLPLRFI